MLPPSSPSSSSISEHDVDSPLLRDIERHSFGSPSSPIFREKGGWHHHRRTSSYASLRLGLHPARRYLGMFLLAVVCFCFGFAAHQPKTIRIIQNRLATHTGLVKPHTEHRPVVDNRAMRVRVLNELMKERYPKGPWTGVRKNNFPALDRLASCLEAGNCGPGEDTVIVLASFRFGHAETGGTSGEEVWARSSIAAFRALNHTLIHTWGHMDTLMVYQHLPDMIPAVLWEQGEFLRCGERNDTNYLEMESHDVESPGTWQKGKKGCMQNEDFPEGIPWWKSFMYLFWAQHNHPLGGNWVAAPEDYTFIRQNDEEHLYLGYSIENHCLSVPTFKEREHRALILAKNDRYFDEEHNFFRGYLAEARDKVAATHVHGDNVDFDLMSTSGDELKDGARKETLETGITTVGRQPQAKWYEMLARSKVLLGIGRPQLSPSPYDALCLGVPFINPVLTWDENEPHNRVKWETQQDALKYTDEPYVYHVFAKDVDGLAAALQRAVNHPIDRYIPDNMRMDHVIARHEHFLKNNWQEAAIKWVEKTYGEEADKYKHLTMDMPALDERGYFHNRED